MAKISPWFYVVSIGCGVLIGVAIKRWAIGGLIGYCMTIFSIAVMSRDIGYTSVNCILLLTYRRPNWQVYANIIAFIPIGFLLSSISLKWIWVALAFSGTIEISQLIMTKGMFDVDDMVSNCIGTVLGILTYSPIWLWKYCRKQNEKKSLHEEAGS